MFKCKFKSSAMLQPRSQSIFIFTLSNVIEMQKWPFWLKSVTLIIPEKTHKPIKHLSLRIPFRIISYLPVTPQSWAEPTAPLPRSQNGHNMLHAYMMCFWTASFTQSEDFFRNILLVFTAVNTRGISSRKIYSNKSNFLTGSIICERRHCGFRYSCSEYLSKSWRFHARVVHLNLLSCVSGV